MRVNKKAVAEGRRHMWKLSLKVERTKGSSLYLPLLLLSSLLLSLHFDHPLPSFIITFTNTSFQPSTTFIPQHV